MIKDSKLEYKKLEEVLIKKGICQLVQDIELSELMKLFVVEILDPEDYYDFDAKPSNRPNHYHNPSYSRFYIEELKSLQNFRAIKHKISIEL